MRWRRIVGSSAEELREAGEGFVTASAADEAVFARQAIPDPEYVEAASGGSCPRGGGSGACG